MSELKTKISQINMSDIMRIINRMNDINETEPEIDLRKIPIGDKLYDISKSVSESIVEVTISCDDGRRLTARILRSFSGNKPQIALDFRFTDKTLYINFTLNDDWKGPVIPLHVHRIIDMTDPYYCSEKEPWSFVERYGTNFIFNQLELNLLYNAVDNHVSKDNISPAQRSLNLSLEVLRKSLKNTVSTFKKE